MDKTNLEIIRESFGKVVYSHKTHEKDAEIESDKVITVKWVNKVLTAITSGALLSSIFTNQNIFNYISAIFSTITLGFVIFQLSFNPQEKVEKHTQSAKELWYIREQYVSFMSDIICDRISDATIVDRRNKLIDELRLIYKFAPRTSKKAYNIARNSLKIKDEMTFSDEEIDRFLPDELKIKKIRKT